MQKQVGGLEDTTESKSCTEKKKDTNNTTPLWGEMIIKGNNLTPKGRNDSKTPIKRRRREMIIKRKQPNPAGVK